MHIHIRTEEPKDYRRVEEITREAFSYPGRIERGGIGSPFEHWMVHELRYRDGIRELSLVAEADNRLVGHIICSNADIEIPDGKNLPVLDFGPFSVLPAYQRQGVGKALMLSMITKAKDMGYGAIMFFGRPEYYPQFGFIEAASYGVTDINGNTYPAFMAMELKERYFAGGKNGKFHESDIYDDAKNGESVRRFDTLFRKMTPTER